MDTSTMPMLPDYFPTGLASICICICFLCFFYVHNKYSIIPPNWPLIGMSPVLFFHYHDLQDYCTHFLEKTGGTFFFKGPWFANKDLLVTADPADVRYTSSTKFSDFPRGDDFKAAFDVFGDGFFNTEGEKWSLHRKISRGFFSHPQFNQFTTTCTLQKVKEGLIPVLDHACSRGLVVDLQDIIQRYAYDLTYQLVAGCDPKKLSADFPEAPFSKAMDDAMKAVAMRQFIPRSLWSLQRWLGIGRERELERAKKILNSTAAEQVMSKRTNSHGKGFDIITTYITTGEMFKSTTNEKVLCETIVGYMLAGKDTTSSGLNWFFWAVSRKPSVLAKIREEIESVLPLNEANKRHLFTAEELSRMTYLRASLYESLRLYPPVPFHARTPAKPDILPSGHRVHPNMLIVISTYAMGRMTSLWGKDSKEFKPERWITEKGEIKHEPAHKFFTFNAGPRICLGKELAFTQMKAAAATMLHNYDIEFSASNLVKPVVSIILQMEHGLKATVKDRWA